jgi:hypothetical protein
MIRLYAAAMNVPFRLGVDFGTSTTIAFLQRPDGQVEPLLFDGTPLLPSAVFAQPGGGLLVGRDAIHAARSQPGRFEPSPKRRIDEGTVLIGDVVPVEDLIAAVLRRVALEAHRVAGQPVPHAALTHPAGWGDPQRARLHQAAHRAGLGAAWLVAEPIAAAAYHVRRQPVAGANLVVFDLGAGTVDVAVVRYEPGAAPAPFRVLASSGLADVGGDDIDAAVVAAVTASASGLDRLDNPTSPGDLRLRRQLWDDARTVKEMLSRITSSTIFIPLLEVEHVVTRDDLDRLALPMVSRAIDLTRDVVARAGLTAPPDAVFLVGGASRMPLVAARLHQALGTPPTVVDQPELVVAAGSLALSGFPVAPVRPAAPAPFAAPAAFPAPASFAVPPHVAVAAPLPGQPAGGLPVVGVEPIGLSLPSGEGITLRGQLRPGYGVVEYVFPTLDGGLPLYRDRDTLLRRAAALPGNPLYSALSWQTAVIGDDRRFDLAFVPDHLADGPDAWFAEYLTRCRDICAQLAIHFELHDVQDLLQEGSLLDTVDDTLRRANTAVLSGKYRRQLARLDTAEVIRQWHTIVDAIDRLIRFTD